jgi:ribonuclease P protein component
MVNDKAASGTFPQANRLLQAHDYERVFKQADFKVSNRHFLILSRFNALDRARLGLIVAKKHSKRAVDRNRLKRLIRETFRTREVNLENLDCIVLSRSGAQNLQNPVIHRQLITLWTQLSAKLASSDKTSN